MAQVRPGPRRAKSTTVRTPWRLRFLPLLARVSPELAAALADRTFFTPPPPRRSEGDRLLRTARRFVVGSADRPVTAWRWGQGPAVIAVHGWGGRAAQWTSFVAPLLRAGYSLVAFDAPGHGTSGRGLSSAVDFARALRAVADECGGAHAILAHSLGAAAATLALRGGLPCRRVVFLGPAADPPAWVPRFAHALGLSDGIVDRMQRRSEQRLALPWSELSIVRHGRALNADLLVVHDRDDFEVPWSDGQAIAEAWPGARLTSTRGLGHHRLLRDPAVVAEAVAFVAGNDTRACPSCGEPAGSGWCSSCVDRQLFDPAERWTSTSSPA